MNSGLPRDEEYDNSLNQFSEIHQKMFEAFPELLAERDRLTAAIVAETKEAQKEVGERITMSKI